MKPIALLAAFGILSSAAASAQTIKTPGGVVYTLKACTRQADGFVRCAFALQSQNRTRPFLPAVKLSATTSTGVVVQGDRAEASGKVLDGIGAFEVSNGNVEVPYAVYFKYPASENTIRVLTIAPNQKVVYNNVAVTGAAQVVDRLPGQDAWRKAVKWQGRDYVAMVPGCYATGSTATCYVNLFPSNAKGTVSGDALTYPVTTIQLQNQTVSDGLATVQVGATTFTGVPAR